MNTHLTARIISAYDYAFQLHSKQRRKGSGIPYIAHLMSVSALVMESGGDEDLAIAGLLHDAVEDQGGERTLNEIRQRFGERVANTVLGCSDSFGFLKPSWKNRKERYLQYLLSANSDVLLVSLADKLHNARSLLIDLREHGSTVWERFNGGRSGTLWYYQQLSEIFSRLMPDATFMGELCRVVDEIIELDQQKA